jgi:[FeFe] hydrogenase H-cluster maturation GTPase HydF
VDTTPKANRIHIALLGRTNTGKSSFLNLIAGQDVSIISDIAGTTTDVVEKTMELAPLGPVVFLDTAGLGDTTQLAAERLKKTEKVFERADVVVLIAESGTWTEYEDALCKRTVSMGIPLVIAVNKCDRTSVTDDYAGLVGMRSHVWFACSAIDSESRETVRREFTRALVAAIPAEALQDPVLIGDLVGAGQTAVLVVPVDLEAPKGRLILPQVQTIRDLLDNDAMALVVKERELAALLDNLKQPPALVVCDSQVVLKVCADTPPQVPLTTFSILFSRLKGDLVMQSVGAAAIDSLKPDSKVLIAEACSHHPVGDDIGRVKIPRWLSQYLGFTPRIDMYAGRDYPDTLEEYSLVIHCGGCMFNHRQMLYRLLAAQEAGVPVTNYGVCISYLQGVVERTLAPFPAALAALRKEKTVRRKS